jgi:hypothetical protein
MGIVWDASWRSLGPKAARADAGCCTAALLRAQGELQAANDRLLKLSVPTTEVLQGQSSGQLESIAAFFKAARQTKVLFEDVCKMYNKWGAPALMPARMAVW